jgi:hypothetical protein
VADRGRHAHRPDERVQPRADAARRLHLLGGLADRLDDERDRAALAVVVGDRERDPFAVLVQHDDDELPRTRSARQQRMAHLEQVRRVREILAANDREIRHANLQGSEPSESIGNPETEADVDGGQSRD